MRTTRVLRIFGYGVSLALLLGIAAPGVPGSDATGVAVAQDTGRPAASETPTPVASPGPATSSGQQPGILVPVSAAFVPGMDGAEEGAGTTLIEEGDDIGEGLSNQRVDSDD